MHLPIAHATRIRSLVVVPDTGPDSHSQQGAAVHGPDATLRVATAASDGVVRLWDMQACRAAIERWALPRACMLFMPRCALLLSWTQPARDLTGSPSPPPDFAVLDCSSRACEPLCEATTSARLTCLTYVEEKTPQVRLSISTLSSQASRQSQQQRTYHIVNPRALGFLSRFCGRPSRQTASKPAGKQRRLHQQPKRNSIRMVRGKANDVAVMCVEGICRKVEANDFS